MEVITHEVKAPFQWSISEQELREYWASERKLELNGTKYRVGRMNYGAYFLEPGFARGEMYDFNKGTLWLYLADSKKRLYAVDYDLSE